jgi:pyruvate/2-oxoglutarate dehydrogenase complex dihydrolipoamide dehydrogenase (E3) component
MPNIEKYENLVLDSGRVGRNENEAGRDGIEYRLVKMPMAEVLRTRTASDPRGLMKMLIAKESDEILGFRALGFERAN